MKYKNTGNQKSKRLNFQAGSDRRANNFSGDIKDSEIYTELLAQVAPEGSGVNKFVFAIIRTKKIIIVITIIKIVKIIITSVTNCDSQSS